MNSIIYLHDLASRDPPGVFRVAVTHNPSDPEGFLRRVKDTAARLERDNRFAHFCGKPGLFRQAAVGYSSDPEGFLLKLLAKDSPEPT